MSYFIDVVNYIVIFTSNLSTTFIRGLIFQKHILQSSISGVKSWYKNNNVINRYQYWYSCFVYLRKIWFNKGRLIYNIENSNYFSPIFFPLKTLCSNVIAKAKFLRFFRIISNILCLYYLAYNFIPLAGTRWETSKKFIKLISDRISRTFNHWPYTM